MALDVQHSVAILVTHAGDPMAELAIELLGELARTRATDGFLYCHAGDPLNGWRSDSRATAVPCSLFDELSSNRRLTRIRVVSIASGALDSAESEVAACSQELYALLARNRGHGMKLDDVRVFAPATGQAIRPVNFFSNLANANLVLMPQDRFSDRSFARNVPGEDRRRFASHLAIDLASSTAMWSSMEESPFDDVTPIAADDGNPKVVLVRSMVRALEVPGVATGALVAPGKPLPLPDVSAGFVRSPDASWTIEHVSSGALPDELRFEHRDRDADEPTKLSRGEAWALYRARFAATVAGIPRILFAPVVDEFDVMTADAVQEAVGRDSWVEVLIPGAPTNFRHSGLPSGTPDAAIAELERADSSPVFAEVSAEAWRQVVEIPLSVADGGKGASDLLEAAGDHRFLVTDRELLSLEPQDSAEETVQSLLEAIDDFAGLREGQSSDDALEASSVAMLDSPMPSASAEAIDSEPEDVLRTGAAAVLADGASPAADTSLNTTQASASVRDEAAAPLLVRIGLEMRRQQHMAESRLRGTVDEIREIVQRDQLRIGDAASGLRIPLAAGLGCAVYGLIVFTGAARFSSLEWLGSLGNRVLWAGGALAVVVMALISLWSRHAQRILRLGSLALVIGLAIVLAILPWIRDHDLVVKYIGSGRWMFWPMTAGVVMAAVLARALLSDDDVKWRRSLAQINFQVALAFLYLFLVVASSSYRSVLQPVERTDPDLFVRVAHLSDMTRQRLLIASLLVGLGVALVAAVAITARQVQHQLLKLKARNDLQWLTYEAGRASRERRKLEMLFGQWLGTAAVLSRMFWHPLGAKALTMMEASGVKKVDLDMKKFDTATLELTVRGKELLADRLQAAVIHRGWLRTQYNRAAETFVSLMPRIVNEKIPREDWPMPESCASVASLRDIQSGNAQGDRWSFMRALFDGDFDSELASLSGTVDAGSVFSIVLSNPQAARILSGRGDSESATDFFSTILPTHHQQLPIGLVEGVVFIADDPKLEMQTKLAWPEKFAGEQLPDQSGLTALRCEASLSLEGSVVTAVRVDLSHPFSLSEVSGGFRDAEPLEDEGSSHWSTEDY